MESLPVELLRRIASYTPYPTIHSLSLTSHKLRAAVHDWQVYKSIIDDQIHLFALDPKNLDGVETVSHSVLKHEIHLQPWTQNPITSSMVTITAARYAYADYRAYNLPTRLQLPSWGSNLYRHPPYPLDDSDEGLLRDFVGWGGILAARGHPLIRLIGHTSLHSDNGGKLIWIPGPKIPTHRYTLIFCVSAYLLSDASDLFPRGTDELPEEEEENTMFEPGTGISTPENPGSFLDNTEASLDVRWRGVLSKLANLDQGSYITMPNGELVILSPRSHRDIQYEGHEAPRTRSALDDSYDDLDIKTEGQSFSAFTLLELCVRTVGILGWNYRRLILDGRIPRFRALRWEFASDPTEEQVEEVKGRYDPRQLWGPPVASGIPFEKYMKLEAEFGGDGAGFVWSHLEGMMNKEFLEEGKWMGFYTYGDMQEIDPGMIDIVFTVVDPKELEPQRRARGEDDSDDDEYEYDDSDEDEYEDEYEDDDEYGDEDEEDEYESGENEDGQQGSPTRGEGDRAAGSRRRRRTGPQENRDDSPDVPIIAVKATAKDGLGNFVLWGKFYPQTGKVHLTKVYYQGLESGTMWNWTAFMTPFGIVGRWGHRNFGGYIWLWKEDWYGDVKGNELANRLRHERQA
ncbi:hypothetical protein TWF718_002962 [Orbilia javanica]|uniref:F-box domain-containing protein n=1 Tax=Orbilia javanica TaxID=47235 RepID=A0AAN8MJ64_9PEZI